MEKVEALIIKSTGSRNKMLAEIVNGLVTAGGKRLRPAFVIISAKFGRYDPEKVLPAACAVELLHTATLVHDDVIDRSEMRRGRPTVSEKYGADMAVYTGDFLFSKAVLMLSSGIPADKSDMVARAVKSICEGEVDQYQDRYNLDTTLYTYLKKISRKTAVLFGAACSMGAGIAECGGDVIKALALFGFYYGMAFQIRDDLNDYMSDPVKSGKPVGKDIGEGIFTMPLIYAIRRSKSLKERLAAFTGMKAGGSANEIAEMVKMVKDSGGIEDTEKMLAKYIGRGMKELEKLPECPYRDILGHLLGKLADG